MTSTALMLGITGGAGNAIACALKRHGWTLRALHRDPARAAKALEQPQEIEWHQGDAMNSGDVLRAAQGCDVLVHGVNPPGYRHWREMAIPMLANSIEAAREAGARLVFPGNLYNYGKDAWPLIDEQAAQHPISRKGQVRKEMEQTLARAADTHGLRVLIVRAGDFFGSHGPGAWMERVMIRRGKPVRSVTYPGHPDTGHAWAYLPDLGDTFALLLNHEAELHTFDTFHFGGHYLPRGIEMAEAIRRVAGSGKTPIRRLPWPILRAVSIFNPLFRELLEMRYLWFEDLRPDNRKLLELLGSEPHTPLDQALERTLAERGCLKPDGQRTSQAGSAA